MKKFLLPLVISLAVAIPACDSQQSRRMDQVLVVPRVQLTTGLIVTFRVM